MTLLFFFLSLAASTIGAISGIGGGIIIKPVLDATHALSISTISFLSSCTVLSMSCVSILRNRK
ncbi:MAG TPA: sulfite exporter TauE/SafE family protein, partial [Flexilinea sp.]|nr:sulfite exporter TauE/SafE family protein [Flexilinea sp.]